MIWGQRRTKNRQRSGALHVSADAPNLPLRGGYGPRQKTQRKPRFPPRSPLKQLHLLPIGAPIPFVPIG